MGWQTRDLGGQFRPSSFLGQDCPFAQVANTEYFKDGLLSIKSAKVWPSQQGRWWLKPGVEFLEASSYILRPRPRV